MVNTKNTLFKSWFNSLLIIFCLMIGVSAALAQGPSQSVLLASFRDGNSELYKMAPNGTSVARLTNNGVYDAIASWSPDG